MAKRDGASDGYETISKGETNDCKMPPREWGHFLWASFKAKVGRRETLFSVTLGEVIRKTTRLPGH
jgi:hypothetical protein